MRWVVVVVVEVGVQEVQGESSVVERPFDVSLPLIVLRIRVTTKLIR